MKRTHARITAMSAIWWPSNPYSLLCEHRESNINVFNHLIYIIVKRQPRKNIVKPLARRFWKWARLQIQIWPPACTRIVWGVHIPISIFVRQPQRQLMQRRLTKLWRLFWKKWRKKEGRGKGRRREEKERKGKIKVEEWNGKNVPQRKLDSQLCISYLYLVIKCNGRSP